MVLVRSYFHHRTPSTLLLCTALWAVVLALAAPAAAAAAAENDTISNDTTVDGDFFFGFPPDEPPTFELCGLQSDTNWINWYQTFETDLPVMYPETDADVQEIVNIAAAGGCRVRPVGTGHSYGGMVAQKQETDVIVVSLAEYTPPDEWNFVLDEEALTVRAPAGATTVDLMRLLRKRGYRLPVNLGSHLFSLGGIYLSPSTHGGAYGTDRATSIMMGLRAVTGDASIVEIDEANIRDWRGSMGLLGIVLAVELQVIPENNLQMETKRFRYNWWLWNNWSEATVTKELKEALDGTEFAFIRYYFHLDEILLYTQRSIGYPDDFDIEKDRAEADQFYQDLQQKHPDLAKVSGGRLQPFLGFVGGLVGPTLTQMAVSFSAKSGIDSLSVVPRDGYSGSIDSLTTADELNNFVRCKSDCINDGDIFRYLDATRSYYQKVQSWAYPAGAVNIRLVDVAADTMTLEHLKTPGRYISIAEVNLRSLGKVSQPNTLEQKGLQDLWDQLDDNKSGFHHAKVYGYGPVGELDGLFPFQDDTINNRFYDEDTRKKFISMMEKYDPNGLFAAGEALHLLGLSNVSWDPRHSSVEDSIAATTSCMDQNAAECLSACCCDDWFTCVFSVGIGYNQCSASGLSNGSACSIDCNCLSGSCVGGTCQ